MDPQRAPRPHLPPPNPGLLDSTPGAPAWAEWCLRGLTVLVGVAFLALVVWNLMVRP